MHNLHHKSHKSHIILALGVTLIVLFTFAIFQDFYIEAFRTAEYSAMMLIFMYLPAFLVLLGLFEVYLPPKVVIKHIGKHSGWRGTLACLSLGMLIPGPLYIAFPLAATLLKKGMSRFNLVIFLSAWSSLKIMEEIFEIQFLGLRFLLLRIAITLPFILLMAFIIHWLHFDEKLPKAQDE